MPHDLSNVLSMQEDIEKSIEIAYEYYASNLKARESRPDLFGKKVYIEVSSGTAGKPIMFWHLISLKELSTDILPCNNDDANGLCRQNCLTMKRFEFLKEHENPRAICIYRASRLPWIVDVIGLANAKSDKVKCWLKSDTHKRKLFIRYQQGTADFILILFEEKTMYRLVSAYPVFKISDMKDFANDYKDFKWEYKG